VLCDIGAPRRLIACACVPSVRLNCSIPRFDRSDGHLGWASKGAGSPAAVIPPRHERSWCSSDFDSGFAAQNNRFNASLIARKRFNSQSEVNAEPEPKEWP
jgi:hypothetical protein